MSTSVAMTGDETSAPSRPAAPRPRGSVAGPKLFGISARRLLQAAYVVLLGFLIVRLVWVMLVPITPPAVDDGGGAARAIDADLSVFGRFDPFGGAPEAVPVEASYAGAAETTLDLRLVGATTGGGIKTATIELPDGRQDAFAVGQEVIGGVQLRDVLPNQAILSRNGLTETLTLKETDTASGFAGRRRASPRDLPPSRVEAAPLSPGQVLDTLSSALRFVPVRGEDDVISGYALSPGSSPELFAASGFAEGDVVTSVDGMAAPQDPEQLLELMADLPPGRPFTVTVERDGVPLDVPIDLGQTP